MKLGLSLALTAPGPILSVAPVTRAPSSLSNLTAYWPHTSASKTIATGVSSWADSAGAARNMTQANGALQPTVVAAALDGAEVVRFDGVDDVLASSALSSLITASAWTIYCVARWRSVATTNGAANVWTHDAVIADSTGYLALTARQGPTYGTNGDIIVQAYNYDGSVDQVLVTAQVNTWYLLRMRLSGGNLGLRVGRAGVESFVASGNTQSLAGVLRLARGNGGAPNVYGAVDLHWALVENAAPNASEDAELVNWVTANFPSVT